MRDLFPWQQETRPSLCLKGVVSKEIIIVFVTIDGNVLRDGGFSD